ncbi:peptidoglycan-binding protein [Streptomyces phaeochromogenes]|uniref:peptidoglycan-binding domain-containing protein n=1 Tax=Streptomyces phaeochromogenes TaxID=1923 RepID=UPI00224ED144|nr:peptidoglycan-binding domain-containing protein [Streptomyces phaeochromogenes]MCX5603890.1 peptidoglycan-binding protein [Streptomyces phaeochromogenes]
MKKVHTLRAKAGVTAGLMLVAGLGVAATASPAAAAGYCDTGKSIMKGSSNHIFVPANGTSTSCTMAQGASGNHVKALQRALKDCYDVGLESEKDVDGVFGPKTYSALWAAQGKAGTKQDGIYGPNTRDALKWPRYKKLDGSYQGCGSF